MNLSSGTDSDEQLSLPLRATQLHRVVIEPTYACQLRCRHCYVRRALEATRLDCGQDRILAPAFWLSLLSHLPKGTHVHFTGGEPFCYPEARTLLRAAADRGDYSLVTNGLGLSESVCGALGARPPRNVTVSIHGTAEIHDRITGVSGSHAATVLGLRRVLRHVPNQAVSVNYTLLADNCHCLPAVVSFLADLGVGGVVVQPFDASVRRAGVIAGVLVGGAAREQGLDSAVVRETLAALSDIASPTLQLCLPDRQSSSGDCEGMPAPGIGWTCCERPSTMRCGAGGQVYTCHGQILGYLERQSWEEIWRSAAASRFRQQPVSPYCIGCCKLRRVSETETAGAR